MRSWRGHDAGPIYLEFRDRCAERLGRDALGEAMRDGGDSDPEETLRAEQCRLQLP